MRSKKTFFLLVVFGSFILGAIFAVSRFYQQMPERLVVVGSCGNIQGEVGEAYIRLAPLPLYERVSQYTPDWDEFHFTRVHFVVSRVLDEFQGSEEYLFGVCSEVTVELVLSVIIRESNGRLLSTSSQGAVGLMQVMPLHLGTLCSVGILESPTKEELFILENNIRSGTYVLLQYAKRAKSLKQALAWYNAGPRREHKGRSYASRVLKLKRVLEGASGDV